MRIDWISKLQHLLQVLAFCLAVAAIQYAFQPDRPYGPPAVYSLFIGTLIWAAIDIGRHLLPSAAETGWPKGWQAIALVTGGIAAGFLLGDQLANRVCLALGLYAPGYVRDPVAGLRNSLLISVMAGAAGTYYFYNVNRGAYLERKMGEARKLANESRLKLLEAQLEPHMLFNTLANLRALIAVDPQRAQRMLDHLIAYLRATLGASRADRHSVADEFARLGDYLALMSVRMGPRLAYAFELPPALAACAMPPLLLQPLVENSIRHGLEPRLEGGRIDISARREGDTLWLEVRDTGLGLAGQGAAPAGQGTGFGLAQVRERLAALYGDAAGLQMHDAGDGGARAVVHLPL